MTHQYQNHSHYAFQLILNLFCCLFLLFQLLPVEAGAAMVMDQTGEKMNIPDSPQRVLALAPSLTEMIFSLGAGSKLVGATQFSNFPPAAKKLPRVGSYVQLDVERIVALQPDLCLAIKDGNPRRAVDAVKSLGIPVFAVNPRSIKQVMETLVILGELLHTQKQAEQLASELQKRIDTVRNRIAGCPEKPGVFFQIAAQPLISAGKNSFIDRLISLAGGTNLAGTQKGYPRYSWENILRMAPDVVVISSMAGSHPTAELKENWQRWPEIPAVKHERLYVVDADLFNRPTTRLIDGLEILADLLHPKSSGENSGRK